MNRIKKLFQKNILLIGIAVSVIYWFVESAIDTFIFGEGTFHRRLTSPDPNEAWMRLFIASIIIGFSRFAQKSFDGERRAYLQIEASKRAILDTAYDAFIQSDQTGLIVDWNARAEAAFGWSKKEVIGKSLVEIIIPSRDREAHKTGIKRFLDTSESRLLNKRMEIVALHRDGCEFPVKMTLWATRVGDTYLFNGFLHDISEDKKAEENQRLAATVIEGATEAIMVTDARANILSVNPSFTKITGYTATEVIGKNPGFHKSGRHDKAFYKKMWHSINTTGHWEGEIWDRKKNGEIYPKWLSITAVKDKNGNTLHYTGLFTDITEQKEYEKKLYLRANYDLLTGLVNRELFSERLSNVINTPEKNDYQAAVFFIDLDHFKQVNDALGHMAGDELLKMASKRLGSCIRGNDTIARFGGDEFLMLLSDYNGRQEIEIVAKRIIAKLAQPFRLDRRDVYLGASIGISVAPFDGDDVDTLIKKADLAMNHSKKSGRNTFYFFSQKMEKVVKEETLLEWDLKKALDNQEMILYYQPIVGLPSLKTASLEALIRWKHPRYGLIPPDRFIPLAEHSELISKIGEWVVLTACTQMKQWQERYRIDTTISVNVSSREFQYGDFQSSIMNALEKSGLQPDSLILEITEGLMFDPNKEALKTLQAIKGTGIKISIDDFGTGYSSLSYLSKYSVDFLKIDRSFIKGVRSDSKKQHLVEAIVRMGHSMGITVIAEGIENHEDLSYLVDLGCHKAQGYYFSKPLSAEDYEAVLDQKEVLLS